MEFGITYIGENLAEFTVSNESARISSGTIDRDEAIEIAEHLAYVVAQLLAVGK